MSKVARLTVLSAALMSLLAVVSSSAGAVTWHNTGDQHFSATGGAGTLTSTAVTQGCSGSDTTGTTPASPFVGATYAVSGTIVFTGCTRSAQEVGFDCGYSFTGTTWAVGPPAITSGNIDMTCGLYLATSKICHISGSVPATYRNAEGATPGQLILTTSGSLTATNGAVGTCQLGNGDSVHLTQLTFNVLPDAAQPYGPTITRTA